jgi:hypothetical protein
LSFFLVKNHVFYENRQVTMKADLFLNYFNEGGVMKSEGKKIKVGLFISILTPMLFNSGNIIFS